MLDVQKFQAEMLEVTEGYKRYKVVEKYFEENETMTREIFVSLFTEDFDTMEGATKWCTQQSV